MRQAGEPSVEEILESIKKVIARDNRAGAAEERREREERGVAEEVAPAGIEDVLDLAGMGEYVEADEAAEDIAHAQADEAEDDALVGTETVSSISESLAALAMMAQPPAAP
ncbi:MAG: DUF2497 domain-containing protein, partial [Novosphingobium sp.]